MIFNFFKKDKRSKLKKELDEIDATYIAEGGKKISDEAIRKAEENLKKIYEDGEEYELKLLKEMSQVVKTIKLKLKMLKEMNAELRKEKLVEETADQGTKISDQMTLDALKSKYEAVLKENGGQRNENIETLMKNLDKR